MAGIETNRRKVAARLERDGWVNRGGGLHDVFTHPVKPGRIVVPRHREISYRVAHGIAKDAGWKD